MYSSRCVFTERPATFLAGKGGAELSFGALSPLPPGIEGARVRIRVHLRFPVRHHVVELFLSVIGGVEHMRHDFS